MFINKSTDGRNNICGLKIRELRINRGLSQNQLASKLQLHGLILDKNAIQRIESGQRFVTDIELRVFAMFFELPIDALLP